MHDDAIQAYCDGADILYRVQISTGPKPKMSGWRSYRKRSEKKNIPWPWDMPQALVYWKISGSHQVVE